MKTSDLIGHALDWAVAKCEGHIRPDGGTYAGQQGRVFHPSTDWLQGGPIIEREAIRVGPVNDSEGWFAYKYTGVSKPEYFGPTPLVAAMRCYVASKLGYEVEIPEEVK
jgi:hypothetical protein